MNKLEFTNKVIDNLNDSIHEDGKVGLAKFIELTNKLYEAINYTRCCTELCEVCNNEQVFETEDGYMADCPRCN
jgi:hypothetical protein